MADGSDPDHAAPLDEYVLAWLMERLADRTQKPVARTGFLYRMKSGARSSFVS